MNYRLRVYSLLTDPLSVLMNGFDYYSSLARARRLFSKIKCRFLVFKKTVIFRP